MKIILEIIMRNIFKIKYVEKATLFSFSSAINFKWAVDRFKSEKNKKKAKRDCATVTYPNSIGRNRFTAIIKIIPWIKRIKSKEITDKNVFLPNI